MRLRQFIFGMTLIPFASSCIYLLYLPIRTLFGE